MRASFYVSQNYVGMLKLSVDLGKPELKIDLSDKDLNWHSITLQKDQVEKLKKFLNETPME